MKIHAVFIILFTALLMCSCADSPASSPPMVIEAADYQPVGEGLKYLALAILGGCVLLAVAACFRKPGPHDDQ